MKADVGFHIITGGGLFLILGMAALGVYFVLNSGSVIYQGGSDGSTVTTKANPWLMGIVFVVLGALSAVWLNLVSQWYDEEKTRAEGTQGQAETVAEVAS